MISATVSNIIIIGCHGDVTVFPLEFLGDSDDFIVSAVGGPREEASNSVQAYVLAIRKARITVKDDYAFEARMDAAPNE